GAAQGLARVLAGRAQALQLDLEHDAAVQVALGVADVAAADQANGDAAAVPLHAGDRLDGLAVEQRGVVPADQVPGVGERIQDRAVGLPEQAAPVAVAEVAHPAPGQQVAGAEADAVLAPELRAPLVGHADVPAVAGQPVDVGHPGGLGALHRAFV